MTRAELIDLMANKMPSLSIKDIDHGIKGIFEHMSGALESGRRIEIRGFGSFSLRYRPPRKARNPKTGDYVQTQGKYAPHFKPGKALRERVNQIFLESLQNTDN